MSYKKVRVFESDKPVLAFSNGNYFAKSFTAVGDDIALDKNDKRTIPIGMFWATDALDEYRPLPRAKVVAPIATTSPDLSIYPIAPFRNGDQLKITEPYVTLTITAATVGQTQSITVKGATASATADSTSVEDLALKVVNAISNTYPLNSFIYAIQDEGKVLIFPKDGKTLYEVTEGGTATATLSGAEMVYNSTVIGTVSYVDARNEKVVLTTNAAVTVPAGVNVGAPIKEIVGMSCGTMDFSDQNRINVALLTASSGVRIEMLPYFEEAFRDKFPRIRFDYNI